MGRQVITVQMDRINQEELLVSRSGSSDSFLISSVWIWLLPRTGMIDDVPGQLQVHEKSSNICGMALLIFMLLDGVITNLGIIGGDAKFYRIGFQGQRSLVVHGFE